MDAESRGRSCAFCSPTTPGGAGISVHGVARLLGHADATLVLRRYGHALPDELAGAADTLTGWLESREIVTGLSQDSAEQAANPHG